MQPDVKPLSYKHRNFVFITLLVVFLLSLPTFIFYAMGYRYSFFAETPAITATGGLYITSEASDFKIFLDEAEVNNARLFRKASYLQGIEPGLHRIHVQVPESHTWVKDLLVRPQIVTEVEAFNIPLVPQVRPVTEYLSSRSEAVYFSTTSNPFLQSSSSMPVVFVPKGTATSTLTINPEYILLDEFFTEKASTTAYRLDFIKDKETNKFGFATVTPSIFSVEPATTTKAIDRLKIFQSGDDVFVESLGTGRQIPHYFCNSQFANATATLENYLLSEVDGLDYSLNDETENQSTSTEDGITDSCRKEIRIDRKWQTVHDFDFMPDNSNLVLMHLDDGIHVVEIDDRSWQNTQQLYFGQDITMLVYRDSIFVKDGNFIFEVLTSINK